MSFARTVRSSALGCAILLLLCALLARPFAEVGGNDDFAYARSAKILADTGHIAYVGWSSAMLGWQLALGAAFIKLFGFSFTATRMAVLCVGIFTAFLLQRTAVRLGLNEWNATLATLTVVLSPIFLALSTSFMSDVPGLLAIVAALYCCARAIEDPSPHRTGAWLATGALLSTILGTARQTGWLGVLIIVPITCWVLRRRPLPWALIAGIWFACVLAVFGCMQWFSHQMYSTAETPAGASGAHHLFDLAVDTLRLPLETAFVLAPLFFAFTLEFFRRSRRAVYISLAVTALFSAFFLLRLHGFWASTMLVPASSGQGNYVTPLGILELPAIGARPTVLVPILRLVASLVCYFSAFAAVAVMLSRRRAQPVPEAAQTSPSWHRLVWVLGSFAAFYCALMSVRILAGNLFDRYLLPLFVVVAILAARWYQANIRPRLPAACYAILLPLAAFGVAALHDMFAADRARLAAIDELRAAGIPRSQFYGGFAYDGWTQIDNEGYIDVDSIRIPGGINILTEARRKFRPCDYWPAADYPTIHARYAVSYDQTCGAAQTRFAPVHYSLWLSPHSGTFYIRTLDPVDPQQPAQSYR